MINIKGGLSLQRIYFFFCTTYKTYFKWLYAALIPVVLCQFKIFQVCLYEYRLNTHFNLSNIEQRLLQLKLGRDRIKT